MCLSVCQSVCTPQNAIILSDYAANIPDEAGSEEEGRDGWEGGRDRWEGGMDVMTIMKWVHRGLWHGMGA